MEDIHAKAELGRYRIRGFSTFQKVTHFDDLTFLSTGLTRFPLEGYKERCNTRTVIGSRHAENPLVLETPIYISGMSYGALSANAKVALGKGASMMGTATCTGDGGMYWGEREASEKLIYQVLPSRYGLNPHHLVQAQAIEIVVGQGAKPGTGGLLMGVKVLDEIADMRDLPQGIDQRSPARHPDWLGPDDLAVKIEQLREATDWRVPIHVKLGACRVDDDVKLAAKAGADAIIIDSMIGATGASAEVLIEHSGVPTVPAIVMAREALRELGLYGKVSLIASGGIRHGADAAKALALGAHATAVGTAAIIAGGCISCMQCHVGTCVVGIATQDPEHEKRYNIPVEAMNIHHFLENVRWQLASILDGLGHADFRQLSRQDLVTLTPEAAAITRLPYAPEYRRKPKPFAGLKPLLLERF
jgi:glutamate synthase domain-containing protein 2